MKILTQTSSLILYLTQVWSKFWLHELHQMMCESGEGQYPVRVHKTHKLHNYIIMQNELRSFWNSEWLFYQGSSPAIIHFGWDSTQKSLPPKALKCQRFSRKSILCNSKIMYYNYVSKERNFLFPFEEVCPALPLTWELRPTFSFRLKITLKLSLVKFMCLSLSTWEQLLIIIV